MIPKEKKIIILDLYEKGLLKQREIAELVNLPHRSVKCVIGEYNKKLYKRPPQQKEPKWDFRQDNLDLGRL